MGTRSRSGDDDLRRAAPPRPPAVPIRLGLSISDSADLAALNLRQTDLHAAVESVCRTAMTSGASVVYGGGLASPGFTHRLMALARQHGRYAESLVLCLPAPEHYALDSAEVVAAGRFLGPRGTVIRLDDRGTPIPDGPTGREHIAPAGDGDPYSAARRYVNTRIDARIVVGGQTSGFQGPIPGILEETTGAVTAQVALYVLAGFGGAAALAATALNLDDLSWAPPGVPARPADTRIDAALAELAEAAATSGWDADLCGLDDADRRALSATHRPSLIAALLARGMSRLAASGAHRT